MAVAAGGPGNGEATGVLERLTGTGGTAGATHTSCKAHPLVLLLGCTVRGPKENPHVRP